jgi:hypothetical protein
MADYRIYMLDRNHRILSGSDADCPDDEAAFAWAATTLGTDAHAEVWQSARFLGRVSGVSVLLAERQALAAAGD